MANKRTFLLTFALCIACGPSRTDTAVPEAVTAQAPAPDATQPPQPPQETRVTVAEPWQYFDAKVRALTLDHKVSEGNFVLSVLPMPLELRIAAEYREWHEKRYSEEDMLALIEQERPVFDDSMFAMLSVMFVGDLLSSGRTQFQIPDDICEYIFLENERGDAVRCTRADLPLMRMPGPFEQVVTANLTFSGIAAQAPEFFDTESIRFVVGGLGFSNNTVQYGYPLADLFGDAPDELRSLYRESGVWP